MITFPILAFSVADQAHMFFSIPYSIPKDNEDISPDSMITEILCFNRSGIVSANSCMSISAVEFPRRFQSFNNLPYLSRT